MSERLVEQKNENPYRIQWTSASLRSPVFEVAEFRGFSKFLFCLLTGRI
jgi:hypothetical protein